MQAISSGSAARPAGLEVERDENAVQLDDLLCQYQSLVKREEDVARLSIVEKERLVEAILEQQLWIFDQFFEKLADLVPLARTFLDGLPSGLGPDVRATESAQWIEQNRVELNEGMQTKWSALLSELQEFPKELLLLDLPEKAIHGFCYIFRGSRHYAAHLKLMNERYGLVGLPAITLADAFKEVAIEGYVGLVKAMLTLPAFQKEQIPEYLMGPALLGASANGRTEAVAEIVTFARPSHAIWFLAMEQAAEHRHVETFQWLLRAQDIDALPLDLIAQRLMDIHRRAELQGCAEIIKTLESLPRWGAIQEKSKAIDILLRRCQRARRINKRLFLEMTQGRGYESS